MMDPSMLKSITSLVIFGCGIISVLSPLFVASSGSDAAFSIGNMMASGVLLAAGLTHELAGASSSLDAVGSDFPWATFIAGATFILFLILEESIHLTLSDGSDHHHHHHHHHLDDGRQSESNLSVRKLDPAPLVGAAAIPETDPVVDGIAEIRESHRSCSTALSSFADRHGIALIGRRGGRGSLILRDTARADGPSCALRNSFGAAMARGYDVPNHDNATHERRPLVSSTTALPGPIKKRRRSSVLRALHDTVESMREVHVPDRNHAHDDDSYAHSHDHDHDHDDASFCDHQLRHHHEDHLVQHLHGSVLASLVLLLALSLHSVLGGISIGIVSSVPEIASTAVAILAHKMFAGYALGSTMATAEMERHMHIIFGTTFALTTPLGIFIGMGLEVIATGSYSNDAVPVGVVKAIVAGTFMYVAIVEVGMKELLVCRQQDGGMEDIDETIRRTEITKLAALLGGYVVMSGLAVYV